MGMFGSVLQNQNTTSSGSSSLINHSWIWLRQASGYGIAFTRERRSNLLHCLLLLLLMWDLIPCLWCMCHQLRHWKRSESSLKRICICGRLPCRVAVMNTLIIFQSNNSVTFARCHLSCVPGCRFLGGAEGWRWRWKVAEAPVSLIGSPSVSGTEQMSE